MDWIVAEWKALLAQCNLQAEKGECCPCTPAHAKKTATKQPAHSLATQTNTSQQPMPTAITAHESKPGRQAQREVLSLLASWNPSARQNNVLEGSSRSRCSIAQNGTTTHNDKPKITP